MQQKKSVKLKNKKTIKSFKQLSELNKKELFEKDKLKSLDRKFAVSIARQLATGFDNIDLRKKPTKSQNERARKIIKEFYEIASYEKTKLVRPRKENRKIYAEYNSSNKKFKVFALPVVDNKDIFKIDKKKKRLKRISEYESSEFFAFDPYDLVKYPRKEVTRVWNQIKEKYKNKDHYIKIKTSSGHLGAFITDKQAILDELNSVIGASGQKALYNIVGLTVYRFKNQEPLPTKPLLKKGQKKKKYSKNLKNISKRRK